MNERLGLASASRCTIFKDLLTMSAMRNDKGAHSVKRLSCSLFFVAAGVGIGAWASSLPLLTAQAKLDKGQLGLVLLCFALGAIVVMVNVGRYLDLLRKVSLISVCGSVTFGVAVSIIPNIENQFVLAGVVFIAGAGFGALDVSMNTEASEIERETGRHLMSSFHALFSIGNLFGAFAVGKLIAWGRGLHECLMGGGGVVLLMALSTLFVSQRPRKLPPHKGASAKAQASTPFTASQRLLIAMFGVIGFLAFLAEGGLMDWTAIYMVDVLGTTESNGAYAFAIFASMMAAGRLAGDYATKLFGHVRLLQFGGVICAISLVVMLTVDSMLMAFGALAVCGAGVANMVPTVFAAAGKIGAQGTGKAMAAVTTMGYSGLLLGPAILGFVAQAWSLMVSIALITLAFALILALAAYLKARLERYKRAHPYAESFT
ncbi:MFS transporter [Mesorhizobium sp. RMAD-H1]|uniref:MFS transporter n=1 Tax=Mesorhizobium sp. RMAD-H1 TaxID=2587065 RepID=UPI001854987D|nr:MFS transporter [Mesorhizobium sp. RMAD-H1]MBB2973221.1 fucose permease [Mesorhizobium sp. RMAD-H1]